MVRRMRTVRRARAMSPLRPAEPQEAVSGGRELTCQLKGLQCPLRGARDVRLKRCPERRGQGLHWLKIDEFVSKEAGVQDDPEWFRHSRRGRVTS